MQGKFKHIYFLGIGGIGMSALARYFNKRGVKISGYDKTPSAVTRELEAEGISVNHVDDISYVPADVDFVVITPAIPQDLLQLEEVRRRGIPLKKRAEVLGIISNELECLAVAGTHGKTTTSTLLTHLLISSGIEVNSFLGGISANYHTNYLQGASSLMVAEADEYDRSFLHLNRKGAIVTSCDPDHLDIYGNADSVKASFQEFLNGVTSKGHAVVKHGLPLDHSVLVSKDVRYSTYGVECGVNRAENITVSEGAFVFDYRGEDASLDKLRLHVPGRHNVENAVAAITLALSFGATKEGIVKGVETFKGVQRRFEFILRGNKVLIDDYAHHPEELRATISAAKELFPGRRVAGIFQPHLFTRTRDFADGFAESLSLLDDVILLDIYPARELPLPGVTSELILEKIVSPRKRIWKYSEVANNAGKENFDVLLMMGAGDIDRLVQPVAAALMGKEGQND